MQSQVKAQENNEEDQKEQISVSQIYSQLSSQSDPEQIKILSNKFKQLITKHQRQDQSEWLQVLSTFLMKGYADEFTTQTSILKRLMEQSIKLSYDSKNQMIFVLSLIAEMIKEVPRLKFPFTKKFIDKVFLLDQEFIKSSQHRKNIIAILSVLYENLSAQQSLLKHYKISTQLKLSLLQMYSHIQQVFSIKLFNRALYNLSKVGQELSQADIQKYGLHRTLSHFVEKKSLQIFMRRLENVLVNQQKKEQ